MEMKVAKKDLKLVFSNPEYHVYETRSTQVKTVICLYNCKVKARSTQETLMAFKVCGKSECSKQDEFNELLGKRLAESRAKLQAYKNVKQSMAADINKLEDIVEKSCSEIEFYDQMKYLIQKESERIEDLKDGNIQL
jgi:hypothetical protein